MSRSEEIQEAAVELFYDRGYQATSLKDIAGALNLRAPSLYNHMSSKQELLRGIMFAGIEQLQADFDAALGQSEDTVEQVRLCAEALVHHNIARQKQAYVNTYEIPQLDEPLREQLISRRRTYIVDGWGALIARGAQEGVLVAPEPLLATFNVIDLCAGLARWYRPGGQWSEKMLHEHFGHLVLTLLGAELSQRH